MTLAAPAPAFGAGRAAGAGASGHPGASTPSRSGSAPPPGRNRVTAAAEIVAVAGPDGTTRLPVLASQVPLVLRRTPSAVYLVGGAAGPIGGDSLTLRVTVGADAFLRLRTAAASIALPGLDGAESVLRVSVTVAPGGRLEYLPEPVVVTAGARHATVLSVTLADGASLLLRDELVLGRHGEAGGTARSVLRADYAGRPLLRHSVEVAGADPVSRGPALLAGHRGIGTLLLAGAGTAMDIGLENLAATASPEMAVMHLAGPAVLVTALADDAVTLRRRLTLPG
jgi:urease accessory protein